MFNENPCPDIKKFLIVRRLKNVQQLFVNQCGIIVLELMRIQEIQAPQLTQFGVWAKAAVSLREPTA